jgi:hypothetical protein
MPTNEKSQMYDFDLDNIKDPFATKVQLANSPQLSSNNQPENAISESETVKENPFEALKTDFIVSDSSEIISSVFKELSTDPILDFGEFGTFDLVTNGSFSEFIAGEQTTGSGELDTLDLVANGFSSELIAGELSTFDFV